MLSEINNGNKQIAQRILNKQRKELMNILITMIIDQTQLVRNERYMINIVLI